jgi:hypothetical protein
MSHSLGDWPTHSKATWSLLLACPVYLLHHALCRLASLAPRDLCSAIIQWACTLLCFDRRPTLTLQLTLGPNSRSSRRIWLLLIWGQVSTPSWFLGAEGGNRRAHVEWQSPAGVGGVPKEGFVSSWALQKDQCPQVGWLLRCTHLGLEDSGGHHSIAFCSGKMLCYDTLDAMAELHNWRHNKSIEENTHQGFSRTNEMMRKQPF